MVQGLRSGLNPDSVSCDYEVVLFQTVAEYLPRAQLLGCFFHFVKNFKTLIETHELRAQYNGGADFSLQARMIPALAFVPAEDLVRAVEDLSETCPNRKLQPLLYWLEDIYIGRPHRRGRRQPLFPHEMWNLHRKGVQHLDRMNNHAEAAHRRIQAPEHLEIHRRLEEGPTRP